MKFFNLPDLGEGIPEADIVEWHIAEGDNVTEDQVIVSVETAKAVVEVPSPVTGVIAKLYGQPGDTILTGAPLLEFVSDQEDTGTVVGELATASSSSDTDDSFFIGTPPSDNASSEGSDQTVAAKGSLSDLAANLGLSMESQNVNRGHQSVSYPLNSLLKKPEPLKGVRKHMARTMAQSHAEVVPVTLFDEVDIDHWQQGEDITVRLIKAIIAACKKEPALNAWFDGASLSREVFENVHLGLAVDSAEGLFVPVIRNAEQLDTASLRDSINGYREAVANRSLAPDTMQGATITLSNFGVFAGQFATPVVVPPMVCILGTGRLKEKAVSVEGSIVSRRIMPISMSFDHRAVTGGEATRFLQTVLEQLSK
ncbi:2-oxo acid dehydrogenase subunit E2 [Endozoicomonas sp. OPT23]|uniref:dihydrolipoamide acetyltransferase family protein n=1 Tax=Endozoicomonas sp. OPT23 TaxID=2072845 RepID=UPI00129BB769|nr:dihydrolipoamide acetyltransferase family protein [Endozoicomonas sp. OPT23]MRI33218.1 2-oxo acid dehydrogenase subunit E2 [Endozoicomonas sp. OPT23]